MKINIADKTVALKNIPFLEDLNSFEMDNFALNAELLKFGKNAFIYEENSAAEKVYFVFKGKVKLASTASCGKTLIKDIIHKQDVFGENIFHEGTNRTEYAQATEAGTMVFVVDKKQVLELVARNKNFANKLMKIIMVRMNNLEQRMQNFVFLKAKSRISEFIGRMGSQRGIKIGLDEWLINHGLSHKEIAYMTDTSRQTVARVLGELKTENLIHFSARKPSKILIRNIAALRAV